MESKTLISHYSLRRATVLLLLFIPSFSSCSDDKLWDNNVNPFLVYYLRNGPTLNLNTSDDVMIQQKAYLDYDKKTNRQVGDMGVNMEGYTIYLFKNKEFAGLDIIEKNNQDFHDGAEIWRAHETAFIYSPDGSIKINQYRVSGTNPLNQEYTIKRDNNILISNDGARGNVIASVITLDKSRYCYYTNYESFRETSDTPNTTIEFDGKNVSIYSYNFLLKKMSSVSYFQKGILMKKEDLIHDEIYTYTVSSGIGELVITNMAGKIIERQRLERKLDNDGYLIYQGVRLTDGTGYEWFITKDTFR
jgi:hypothetical protein